MARGGNAGNDGGLNALLLDGVASEPALRLSGGLSALTLRRASRYSRRRAGR